MRGGWTPYLPSALWCVLAVGGATGLALVLLLPRPQEQALVAAPPSTPVEPSAAVVDDYLSRLRSGIAAYHAQRYAEAIQAFEQATTLQPSQHQPYRYLAELYWRAGKPEQAWQALRSLAAVMPDAYVLDQVGRGYEELGLRELATQVYREAVHLDPGFPSARYNLGRAYLEAGDLERGIAEIQETLRLHPDFPEAHQALGMAYTEQGRLAEAIAHLEHALVLNPDLTVVRNHVGRIYLAQGRLDEAIQTFRPLVERAPDVAEARHNLAVAYARRGLQEVAVEQFREALRLRPDFHAARLDLATLLLEMRRPQDAIDILKAGLLTATQTGAQIDQPDPFETRYRLGIAYRMAGQAQQAIQELEAVLQAQPAHAGAHAHLGSLYYQTRQFERAWGHARQAESLGAPVAGLIAALRRVSVEPR
jgi:tetratricopeptide (TPR) repeat protein